MANFGAALFDDPNNPEGGWASLGAQKALRFEAVQDVPSDGTFWTNAPVVIPGAPHLKTSSYLEPSLSELLQEIGADRSPVSDQAEVASEIFGRVIKLGIQRYGLSANDMTSCLAEDLARTLVYPLDKEANPQVNEAMRHSHQTWQSCALADPPDGSERIFLHLPRVQHAIAVLNTPLPQNYWSFGGDSGLPIQKRVNWILTHPKPCLARVAVKAVRSEVASVVSFGSGESEGRLWMTPQELLVMSRIATVEVEGLYVGLEDVGDPEVTVPFVDPDPFDYIALSSGILASHYVAALCRPSVDIRSDADEPYLIFSPRATWLAATDRMLTMSAALALHAAGFCIEGYGRGRILVACPPDALQDLHHLAGKAGLYTPLSLGRKLKAATGADANEHIA